MIQKISHQDLALTAKQDDKKSLGKGAKISTLYSGISVNQVSAPGGVAVDNFNIFWTNKAVGTMVGSVIKGMETPPSTNVAASVRPIAKNAVKSYGVCLVNDNVF